MIRTAIVAASAVALASCTQLTGGSGENYRHLLTMLCNAPPNIMGSVLNTPELQNAWGYICGHSGEVPATPVNTMTIALEHQP